LTIHRHNAGLQFGRERIEQGRLNTEDQWSFDAEDGNQLLGPSGNDWENFGRHHLGWDDEENPETKARWAYPFAKDGVVFESGLNAVRSRAAAEDDDTVFTAAGTLKDMIEQRRSSRQTPEKPIEVRSAGEVRAIEPDGQFEGYIAVWDTVDDFNSTFARGAFKKTIEERGDLYGL